jgi:hypothetical protein
MFDAIKPLLDSGLITEDVSQELNEAWESKQTKPVNRYVENSEKSLHNATSMTRQ